MTPVQRAIRSVTFTTIENILIEQTIGDIPSVIPESVPITLEWDTGASATFDFMSFENQIQPPRQQNSVGRLNH